MLSFRYRFHHESDQYNIITFSGNNENNAELLLDNTDGLNTWKPQRIEDITKLHKVSVVKERAKLDYPKIQGNLLQKSRTNLLTSKEISGTANFFTYTNFPELIIKLNNREKFGWKLKSIKEYRTEQKTLKHFFGLPTQMGHNKKNYTVLF